MIDIASIIRVVVYVVLVRDDLTETDVTVDSVWTEQAPAERHAETVHGWVVEHELRSVTHG